MEEEAAVDEVVPGDTAPLILIISFIFECFYHSFSFSLFIFFPILATFQTSCCDLNFRSSYFKIVFCFFRYFLISSSKYTKSWKGQIYFVTTWNKSGCSCFSGIWEILMVVLKCGNWCLCYPFKENLFLTVSFFVQSNCFFFTKNSQAIAFLAVIPAARVAFVCRVADLNLLFLSVISVFGSSGSWQELGRHCWSAACLTCFPSHVSAGNPVSINITWHEGRNSPFHGNFYG